MVHHPANELLLEFEDSAVTTMSLSNLSLDVMPGMVKSSSLTSCSTTDCDSDSLSSIVRSPSPLYNLSSPRAIFDSYWSATSSPSLTRTRGAMRLGNQATTVSNDEEVLARLQATLRLPSTIDDENKQVDDSIPESQAEDDACSSSISTPDIVRQPSSLDDTLVDYQAAMAKAPGRHSTRTSRRRILPSPPPPPSPHTAAVSPSLYIPPSFSPLILPCQSSAPSSSWWFGMRPWSSTSALLHAKQPSQSCLRKSRYSSFSGAISPSSNDKHQERIGHYHHDNRSVSFYSQVSVLEFTVPQEKRSQEGWSKYFV